VCLSLSICLGSEMRHLFGRVLLPLNAAELPDLGAPSVGTTDGPQALRGL
jgi:hypothetical protein